MIKVKREENLIEPITRPERQERTTASGFGPVKLSPHRVEGRKYSRRDEVYDEGK